MGNHNEVTLIGYVGQVELVNANGTPICNVRLATHESWTDKRTQQKVERTEWHYLTLFNESAQNFAKYVGKGRNIMIKGRLQTREHPAKAFTWHEDYKQRQPINYGDGSQAQIAARSTEIIVGTWKFMDKKPEESAYPAQGTVDAQVAVVGDAPVDTGVQQQMFSVPPDGV